MQRFKWVCDNCGTYLKVSGETCSNCGTTESSFVDVNDREVKEWLEKLKKSYRDRRERPRRADYFDR